MYKLSTPTSPTLSARTVNSIAHSARTTEPIPEPTIILSRTDIRASFEAYEQLLSSAKIYRNQMIALAQAAAGFGQSLERLARCKGAFDAGPALQAAAGLHYLMSNHQQLLSDAFYKKFEIPLLENLDVHKATVLASEESYDKSLSEMSKRIKETEAENLRCGRKRQRDLSQFRRALQDLTRQVEDLDRLKTDYYRQTLDTEQNNLNFILSKVSTVVRAEVDIYERISNKGVADPILEDMTTQGPDPFCAYQNANESSEIFSVLPPIQIANPITEFSSATASLITDMSVEDNYSKGDRQPLTKKLDEHNDLNNDDEIPHDESLHNENPHGEDNDQFNSEYSLPLKFHRSNNAATFSQMQLLVWSDTSSIGRHFNPSLNSTFHISDDAEILHNKEFTYEAEDFGSDNSFVNNYPKRENMNITQNLEFSRTDDESTLSNTNSA
ncbi:13405_t:CDS:2 [Cetraspora pellucida]|uniref:13405_t:CDS:1 n=1 Tax=Cetraspora pellucida TaxID=1433469 RepID=A0A9N9E892_9GLOM|nr:13405_t:CDS:2 [Cetraspora pellucida]